MRRTSSASLVVSQPGDMSTASSLVFQSCVWSPSLVCLVLPVSYPVLKLVSGLLHRDGTSGLEFGLPLSLLRCHLSNLLVSPPAPQFRFWSPSLASGHLDRFCLHHRGGGEIHSFPFTEQQPSDHGITQSPIIFRSTSTAFQYGDTCVISPKKAGCRSR